MGMIRVRDFAKACGCTPQNVYKHIRNYATELDGHVEQSRRGMLLDDFAQEFIRDAMYPKELSTDNTVSEQAAEIERLRSALFQASQENAALVVRATAAEGRADRAELKNQSFQNLLQAAEDKVETAQKEAAEAAQKEKEATAQAADLQRKLAEEQVLRAAAEERERALKSRNWVERLLRKGE